MYPSIETIAFKLVAGVAPEDFIQANSALNDWAKKQSGFISRILTLKDDNSWIDMISWESLPQAKLAAEKIMQDLGDSHFMAMIDAETVKINHCQIKIVL